MSMFQYNKPTSENNGKKNPGDIITNLAQQIVPTIPIFDGETQIGTVSTLSMLLFDELKHKIHQKVVVNKKFSAEIFVKICNIVINNEDTLTLVESVEMLALFDHYRIEKDIGVIYYDIFKSYICTEDCWTILAILSEYVDSKKIQKIDVSLETYIDHLYTYVCSNLMKNAELITDATCQMLDMLPISSLFNTANGRVTFSKLVKDRNDALVAEIICHWLSKLSKTEKPISKKGAYDLFALVNWFNVEKETGDRLVQIVSDIPDLELPERVKEYKIRERRIKLSKKPGMFSYKEGMSNSGDKGYIQTINDNKSYKIYVHTTNAKPTPIAFELKYMVRDNGSYISIETCVNAVIEQCKEIGVSLYVKRRRGGPWFPILTQWNWKITVKRIKRGCIAIKPLLLKTGSNTIENSTFKVVFNRVQI
jgi:hypothetical protein